MRYKRGVYMNIRELDMIKVMKDNKIDDQRMLADRLDISLGAVNKSINELKKDGYITENYELTDQSLGLFKEVKSAIILAAGYGMRMVPINTELPKGLLEVYGEPLIERLIKQLHEADIKDVYVVVGFMKEKYEYLIDEYQVKLIVNSEYATKNNMYSLKSAIKYLDSSYIVPCDLYCKENPFHHSELYPWYMMVNRPSHHSNVRVNRNRELVVSKEGERMVGIAYLDHDASQKVKDRINQMINHEEYDNAFWEEALQDKDKLDIYARVVKDEDYIEINTYEQLRELDENSNQLKTDAIEENKKVFDASADEIVNIKVLKKGMTNRSFMFECKGQKYIMRIPGEGTDQLINRREEADVYHAISGKGLCDDPVYINPENGYKITKFLEGVRECDPCNDDDLHTCMTLLKKFHDMKLKVNHVFDIFEKIDFYESLWNVPSMYRDYTKTKENVFKLKAYVDQHKHQYVLTHIDAVPDNFLFYKDSEGQEKLQLTDWEYSSMQDNRVDIAMFSIYSLYEKKQIDHLIDIYFNGKQTQEDICIIYCYIAMSGLLWSNWCEYKAQLGVEFGEYSLAQYRYAKDYYKYACALMGEENV